MNARWWIALLLMFSSWPAGAMEHYSNVAQDQNGRAIVGATVTVYQTGTTTPAVIYSDNGLTVKSNPFTTALDGIYDFYADNGLYDITISKVGYTSIYWDANKTKQLALFDPQQFIVPFGPMLPTNPDLGSWFVLTEDSGLCGEQSGSGATPCRWDGTVWNPVGGGGGGAGAAQGLGPNFSLSGGNTITGLSEAKKLELRETGGTNGANLYWHSSGKWVAKCVVAGVEGACDLYDELNAGKKRGFKDSAGNTDFEYSESTGKISAMTVDAEDPEVNITLYQKLPGCGGDLVGVDPSTGTAGHIWDKDPLSTAPTATAITGTNQSYGVARFPDADGNYGVQITCALPSGWTGQLDAVIWWRTGGTGNARPTLFTKCYADNEAGDAAFNTGSVYTVSAGTANTLQRDVVTNIIASGCAGGELLRVRFIRSRTEGSDTLSGGTFDVEKVELWGRIVY